MGLSPTFAEIDKLGRPCLAHRPSQHCHFPGGGMWTIASTLLGDFLPFLTGHPFVKHYDTFSAVSAGAINTVAALLPRHVGSTEPLYPDFRRIRPRLIHDGRQIFEKPKKPLFRQTTHENFFPRRLLRDIWGAVNGLAVYSLQTAQEHYLGSLGRFSDIFDPTRDQKTGWPKKFLRAMASWASDTPDTLLHEIAEAIYLHQKEKVSAQIEHLSTWLENFKERNADRAHFDHRVLLHHLQDCYQIDLPETEGAKRAATLRDLVAPIIIPAIRTTDDQHVRFVRPPHSIQNISAVSGYVAALYNDHQDVATSVLFSCLQPTMFRTAKDKVTGHDYSDGGSNYTARRAINDMLRLYAPDQRFGVAVFECSLKDRPTYTDPKNLDSSHILNELAAMSRLHLNATGSNDNQDLLEDPRCVSFNYFKRPTIFQAPPLPDGRLREELEKFAQDYAALTLDDCLNRRIPDDLPDITQAATTKQMTDMFAAAGVQAVVRNLPELVDHVKYLVQNGPLSDRLNEADRNDLLMNIDTRFPPRLLEEMKAKRIPHPEFNAALDVTSFYRQGELQPDNVRHLHAVGGTPAP